MGTIWVKEFVGGLDARRLPETTAGGVLILATDGHINRGGEFEKRAAFVPTYDLPAGQTVSLAAGKSSIYVFGSEASPAVPPGVSYQRLQHPDGVTALVRVPSYDLHGGLIYAVGEFADGSIHHFYDGVRVTDWFDGRARASFTITAGGVQPATYAIGSFDVTAGTSNPGVNAITNVTVNGVAIMSGAVNHTGNNTTTATALANAINSFTSTPDYTATTSGTKVIIQAAVTGTAPNGFVVATTTIGDAATGNVQNMSGGANTTTSALSDLKVNGVSIISGPVTWATSNENTADLISAAINGYTSTPEYEATAVGNRVNIVAAAAGTTSNGYLVTPTLVAGLTIDPSTDLVLSGGVDSDAFVPGTFVKTVGSRMHSLSGSVEHFSGLSQPTKWTTDTTGAGFIDMSTQDSGSETLTALAKYQQYLAVFAERLIQIWYFDSDPTLNAQKQALNNTGTASPRSVTQFGDNDLFYLDESGIRSLRARDASNAAATTDIGVPIDPLIVEKLRTMSASDREKIFGLIEPTGGRFWLCMIDTIFVFSFFQGAKVSAWSTYSATINDGTETTAIDIDDVCVFRRKVYIRSGDKIFVYGGLTNDVQYDNTSAKAWLPFLDGGKPTARKTFEGMDVAAAGLWEVRAAMRVGNSDVTDLIGHIAGTTYDLLRIGSVGQFSHISPHFESRGNGPARLSATVVHYSGGGQDDED